MIGLVAQRTRTHGELDALATDAIGRHHDPAVLTNLTVAASPASYDDPDVGLLRRRQVRLALPPSRRSGPRPTSRRSGRRRGRARSSATVERRGSCNRLRSRHGRSCPLRSCGGRCLGWRNSRRFPRRTRHVSTHSTADEARVACPMSRSTSPRGTGGEILSWWNDSMISVFVPGAIVERDGSTGFPDTVHDSRLVSAKLFHRQSGSIRSCSIAGLSDEESRSR